MLNPSQLKNLAVKLEADFGFADNIEFTIEVNPETVTPKILASWQQIGINRISMGVQSLNQKSLDFLGRIHSVEKARKAFGMIRDAGFENVSIDLIYGYLTQDPIEEWEQTLHEVIRWNPEHVSAYSLIIEEDTPFNSRTQSGENLKVDDSIEAMQYEKVMDLLVDAGYKHYEVSNWAKEGFECRHNISYWDDSSYLGIGPSAHGYDSKSQRRYWNYREIDPWRNQVNTTGNGIDSSEVLTSLQRFEERVMLGLRMIDGIGEEILQGAAEEAGKLWPPAKLDVFIREGFLERVGINLKYTRKGLMLANSIEVELTE